MSDNIRHKIAQDLRRKLEERLQALREQRASGSWADPQSASYTNGYDARLDNEIEYLSELLSEYK